MKNNFFILSIFSLVLGFVACQKEQGTKEITFQQTEIRTSNLCPGGENSPAVVYLTDYYQLDENTCCVTLRFWSSYWYLNARIVTSDATGGAGNTTTYSPFYIGDGYVENVCFNSSGVLEFSVQILDSNGNVIACNIFTNPCM